MSIRLIATFVIAALLFTGAGTATSVRTQSQETPPPVAAEQVETPAPQPLTAEEARDAALAHAGLTADQVTALKVKEDREKGVPVWDVEFRQGEWEFEYEIHAETGAVLEWDKEYDPPKPARPGTKPAATEPVATEPVVTEPTATEEPAPTDPPAPPATEPVALLTREEARNIALAHAGFTADQVTALKVKEDREKGVPVWDVEFRQGDWEYEYEIHAETGAILKGDKEYDPPKKVETKPPVTEKPAQKPQTITAEEAKAVALAHAGLTAEQAARVKAELDREDGRLVWEVEFRFEGWEYEYEILAEDGKILHSEKERDD